MATSTSTSSIAGISDSARARAEAISIVCAKNLHQSLWLPATADHGPLRVTYATSFNFSDKTLPAFLFVGPMFGNRYNILETQTLALEAGVRLICVDRPGMGGSTPVPLEQRVEVWIETVPAVLKALDVKYVSLMTHSAGTIYLLNTMYRLRNVLDPEKPYVAIIAPWVDYLHSQTTLGTLSSKLPKSMICQLSNLTKFLNLRVNPAVGWSSGLSSSVGELFNPSNGEASSTADAERYRVSEQVAKELLAYRTKVWLAEDSTAANDEVLLCLKKSEKPTWGVCEDYRDFVPLFCEQEARLRQSTGGGDGQNKKLKLCVFYASSDLMIGPGGQEYFNGCWGQGCVGDVVEFEAKELEGTDHDSVLLDFGKGALREIFERVGKLEFGS